MASVASVVFFTLSLSVIVGSVVEGTLGLNLDTPNQVVSIVENNIPKVTIPSIVGPCAGFNTVNVSIDKLVGTYYHVKSTFPGNEATFACGSIIFSLQAANAVQLASNLTIFSVARTNPKTSYRTWTMPISGISLTTSTNDPTISSVMTFVAYKEGFGFAIALCPQVSSCGLNCGSYTVKVLVTDRNATSDDINKYLISQLLQNYVPINNLVDIEVTNCPIDFSASAAGQLPIDI